jgi:hypothetical protein
VDSSTNLVKLYVRLLNEGTDVSRPTQALDLGDGTFRLLSTSDYDPEDEEWEFAPGLVVRAQRREDENGEYLLAVKA